MTFINTTAVAGSLRRVWPNAGAPTSGTSGTYAGSAAPGDLLVDTTNGIVYKNINTAASPTWIPLPVPKVTAKRADVAALSVNDAGVIEFGIDNIYVYLPTYVGNAGLTYTFKCVATYGVGNRVYALGTQTIDATVRKTNSAIYDSLTIVAGTDGWNIIDKVGNWY